MSLASLILKLETLMTTLRRFLRPRHQRLAQSYPALKQQANDFLTSHDFPADAEHRAMFGQFVQHGGDFDDTINTRQLAKGMRKARAKMLAFYLIKPDRAPDAAQESPTTEESSKPVQDA